MTLLLLGLVIFLGIHSVSIVAPAWRDVQFAQRGEATWKGLYAAVSLLGFVLLIYGYGQARQTPVLLYTPPTALRHVALLLMLPAFVLLAASSLPGRIKTAAKHPMLLGTKVWATAHLLANGNLADVVLFGSFLAWAVADRISLKHRPDRPTRSAPPGRWNDLIALVAGLGLYLVFLLWAHTWLIGVSPLGR